MSYILIVEDDAPLREALETTLKAANFEIASAADGEDGLNKVKEKKPDLILMDIVMPKMDGITMMHKLKEKSATKDIPIIFLTNLSDAETISKIVSEGTFDYLVKSEWDINDLATLVKGRLKK